MKRNLVVSLFLSLSIPVHSTLAAPTMSSPLSGAETVTMTNVADASLPVIGLVSGSLGNATFKLSADKTRLSYSMNIPVLPTTPIFMAHIHLGAPGTNGPVMFWLCGTPSLAPSGSPVPPSDFPTNTPPCSGQVSGELTLTDFVPSLPQNVTTGVSTFEQAVSNILGRNAYTNVHTVTYPNGETRGQILDRKK